MNILVRAQQDARRIVNNADAGFGVPLLFAATDGETTVSATVNGLAMRHHVRINDLGDLVNGTTARVTVHVKDLEDAEYPVRNTNGDISLLKHRVTWTDISGVQATYKVEQNWPNDVLGLIVCQLGKYGTLTPPGRVIIGWKVCAVRATIVATVNPLNLQMLGNGETIRVEYVLNGDKTVTIPYMAGMEILTPFMRKGGAIQNMPFDSATGTFNANSYGGFKVGDELRWNASLPIYLD